MTSTDSLAVGALHAAYSRGVVVPTDLSVVGFDDILLASHTVPALTTLRMPTAEIVAEGVRLAIELARDPTAPRDGRRHRHGPVAHRPPVNGSPTRPLVDRHARCRLPQSSGAALAEPSSCGIRTVMPSRPSSLSGDRS